jgi:hypothetical protein
MGDLPLADAARQAHVSPVTLRKAAERGQLEASKLAGRWFTSAPALARYLKNRRPRGRPAGKMDR